MYSRQKNKQKPSVIYNSRNLICTLDDLLIELGYTHLQQ